MMKRVDLTISPFPLQPPHQDDINVVEAEKARRRSPPPTAAAEGCSFRYRECMKNHAAAIGGHANDGCGEFMPGREGQGVMKCAACGCHRNFHRKEPLAGGRDHPHNFLLHHPVGRLPYLSALPPPPLISAAPHRHYLYGGGGGESRDQDRRSETPDGRDHQVGGGGDEVVMKNKRFRTKFTPEQKERMVEFAERVGWRMQRQNDAAMNEFCAEIGVKRRVLKVWMHNNKNTFRKRASSSGEDNHGPPPPPPPVGDEDDDYDEEEEDEDETGNVGCAEEGGAGQSPVGG